MYVSLSESWRPSLGALFLVFLSLQDANSVFHRLPLVSLPRLVCFLTLFLSLTHWHIFYYLHSGSGNFVPGSFSFQGVYFAPWLFEGEDGSAFTLLRMGIYYSTNHRPTKSAYTLSATVLFLCQSEEDASTVVLHGNMPSSQNPILQSPHFTV